MRESVRLGKFLAEAGIGSRRRCEQLIEEGRVQVNGEVPTKHPVLIVPGTDRVEVDGQLVELRERKPTLLLHKPPGYLTTCGDPEGRPIVLDLLPPEVVQIRVFPVGRLDKDTEGLLLLTADGELAFRLMHPSFGVEKKYRVWAKGAISDETLETLEKGVTLRNCVTAPARVRLRKRSGRSSVVDIVIHEGRKRQVRRMFATVGHKVERLIRLRVGPLTLGKLKPGQWRYLSEEEVQALHRASER